MTTTSTTTATPEQNARRVIQSLLNGSPPNGTLPADCGNWDGVVTALYDAYTHGGTAQVKSMYATLARSNSGLMALMASGVPSSVSASPDPSACPELPLAAQKVYQSATPCASLLDEYIAYAKEASPMTPPCFHEAIALHTASVVVARRAALRTSSVVIFPNLYFLFIALSTLFRKTTGLRVRANLLESAGLSHLLLPHRITPEALVQELGISIPSSLTNADPLTYEHWLDSRAFAAQRGWVLDEAARLFDGLKRDYNTGLLALLLDLYECPGEHTDRTVSRGYTTIRDAYLSFFGVTTPAGISEHLNNSAHWHDGLWARFALITPPTGQTTWQFFSDHIPVPQSLVDGLKRLYTLFPVPQAQVITDPTDPEQKRRIVEITGAAAPSNVELGIGVKDAWETYSKAVGHDLLIQGKLHEALFSCYGRLGTHAIKVAMLLAAMDSASLPVRIELRHFARAQRIVEGWRESLHRVWSKGVTTQEAQTSDKILALLAEAGTTGLAARDIYRPLNLTSKDCRPMLDELVRSGQVECIKTKASNGRDVEQWVLIP